MQSTNVVDLHYNKSIQMDHITYNSKPHKPLYQPILHRSTFTYLLATDADSATVTEEPTVPETPVVAGEPTEIVT